MLEFHNRYMIRVIIHIFLGNITGLLTESLWYIHIYMKNRMK